MPGPFTTRLAARTTVAGGIVDLTFDVIAPAPLAFQAGQFVTLAAGTDATGKAQRRSYSVASPSDDGHHLRFLIRVIPGGAASDLVDGMPIGTEVAMTGPHGFFVLAPQHPGDVVFAATGTGLAPVLPMLAELSRRTETGRRHVYWGLRNQEDLFVPDEVTDACAAAGAQLHIYLSRPSPGWPGLHGRITAPVLESLPSLREPTFYLVGNGAMIDELKKGLVDAGVNRKKQIRTEAFFD